MFKCVILAYNCTKVDGAVVPLNMQFNASVSSRKLESSDSYNKLLVYSVSKIYLLSHSLLKEQQLYCSPWTTAEPSC